MSNFYIKIHVFTEFGEFVSSKIETNSELFELFIKDSSKFYLGEYRMDMENGDIIIIPPEISKKTIFKIIRINE